MYDAGVRKRRLKGEQRRIPLVPVNESISHVALSLIEGYAPGQGLRAADAPVAATAREAALPLATGNARHFKAIAWLGVRVFRLGAK